MKEKKKNVPTKPCVYICNESTTLNSLQNDVPSHLPNNFSLFFSPLLFFVSTTARVLCELTKMLKMQIFSKCLGILSMKYRVLWSQLRCTLMFYQWHWDRGIRGPEWVGTHSLRVFPALMRRCLDTTIRVWSRLIMAPCCLKTKRL